MPAQPTRRPVTAKTVLPGTSKRGNACLRTLYRAVLRHSAKQSGRFRVWAQDRLARSGHHKASVAVANKMARMAWVIMAKGETYRA
ncbi:MAG: hypothetical protein O7D86_02690 [Proteobacteria bacterium]|nr:hypothetical protein [Pseudomonadota bacterium]